MSTKDKLVNYTLFGRQRSRRVYVISIYKMLSYRRDTALQGALVLAKTY